ncbi:MAG: hypothetical protein II983_04755, partial [Firmicutes bacterium]|nr:hypothetical protein [Bacillota bacterium]
INVALKITTQPEDVTVEKGTTAKFTVKAQGNGLKYQWQYKKPSKTTWSNSTVSSAKTATLKVTAKESQDGYQYRCVVTDANNKKVYSSGAELSVLIGKNGYELNVYTGTDLRTGISVPAGTDESLKYTFLFYNSNDPNVWEDMGDRKAGGAYGIPSEAGYYDAFQLSIYDGDFKDNEVVAEFFLETPIVVYEDTFELEKGSITVTRYPADNQMDWYDIQGLKFNEYGYYFASSEDGYAIPMGTPPIGLGKDFCDDEIVIYAGHAYKDTEANLYIKYMSKPYKAAIVDKSADDIADEELIDAADDINLLKYMNGDIDLDATVTRLEAARLIASLDNLKLTSEVSLGFSDVKNLSLQDKKIISANLDARYFAAHQNGTFGTNSTVTRAELVTIFNQIYEVNGGVQYEKCLKDVTRNHWYFEDVTAFYNLGIVEVEGDSFNEGPILMRDALKWMVNARKWDRADHTAATNTWVKVESEHVHAKVCSHCGWWMHKASHVWDDGVVSADKTTITKTCIFCGFEWTEEMISEVQTVSNVRLTFDIDGMPLAIAWDKPENITGINYFDVQLLDENNKIVNNCGVGAMSNVQAIDVPSITGMIGSFKIRVVSVPEEYLGLDERYVDTDLTLNVEKGTPKTEDYTVNFTKKDAREYTFRCDSLNKEVENGHYNLAVGVLIETGRVQGRGGFGFNLGTRDNRIYGDDLDEVIGNGVYRIQMFVYGLSKDGKIGTFTITNVTDWKSCSGAGGGSNINPSGKVEISGDYPVQNLRFDGSSLRWDAPANAPSDIRYSIQTSDDGGNMWEEHSNTRNLSNGMIWLQPGDYLVRVVSKVNGEKVGCVSGTAYTWSIKDAGNVGGTSPKIKFTKIGTDQYEYEISGFAADTEAWFFKLYDAAGTAIAVDAKLGSKNYIGEIQATGLDDAVKNGQYRVFELFDYIVTNNERSLTNSYRYYDRVNL